MVQYSVACGLQQNIWDLPLGLYSCWGWMVMEGHHFKFQQRATKLFQWFGKQDLAQSSKAQDLHGNIVMINLQKRGVS